MSFLKGLLMSAIRLLATAATWALIFTFACVGVVSTLSAAQTLADGACAHLTTALDLCLVHKEGLPSTDDQ